MIPLHDIPWRQGREPMNTFYVHLGPTAEAQPFPRGSSGSSDPQIAARLLSVHQHEKSMKVRAALRFCQEYFSQFQGDRSDNNRHPPLHEPLLSTRHILEALGAYLSRPPCRRTLRRWVKAGMPVVHLPDSPQSLYQLTAILGWLHGRVQSLNIQQKAVDDQFLASHRNRTKAG